MKYAFACDHVERCPKTFGFRNPRTSTYYNGIVNVLREQYYPNYVYGNESNHAPTSSSSANQPFMSSHNSIVSSTSSSSSSSSEKKKTYYKEDGQKTGRI